MKNKKMIIWTLSAILYVGIVAGSYGVYASLNEGADRNHAADGEAAKGAHGDAGSDSAHETGGTGVAGHDDIGAHGHDSEHSAQETPAASEVEVKANYRSPSLTIELRDKNNQAPELEVHHEKRMHLIVVSGDLEEYYHLHPDDQGNGVFQQQIELKHAAYKAFVDIKPAQLDYIVSPIELHAGDGHGDHHANGGHTHAQLQADTELTKTVDGQTVELAIEGGVVGQPTTLHFDSKDRKPEPYLGALGHVVILDEAGKSFIHVHPVSDGSTAFRTQFHEPGLYKLWAEFKFGDRVHVYPFVLEVKQ